MKNIKFLKEIGEYKVGDIVPVIHEFGVSIIKTKMKGKLKQCEYVYRVDVLIYRGYAKEEADIWKSPQMSSFNNLPPGYSGE